MTALLRAALLASLLLLAGPLRAQDPLPVPGLSGRVIDQTNTLPADGRAALEDRLARLEREQGAQAVVLIVASTLPEDIADYAQRVADNWKIGRRDVGDGLLIVVAKDDRRMRIEVAKALEGAVPDLAARQIIDNVLRPKFRAGDYAGGLLEATDQLSRRIAGEGLPLPGAAGPDEGTQWQDLGVMLFFLVPIVGMLLRGMFGSKLGTLATAGGSSYLAWTFTHSLLLAGGVALGALVVVGLMGAVRGLAGRGGGGAAALWGIGGGGWSSGGSSSDGGGFSSGGGGDFGGGGSSGDW